MAGGYTLKEIMEYMGHADLHLVHRYTKLLPQPEERDPAERLNAYLRRRRRGSGCHLHFEEWSEPGWYSGGARFDPLPDLLAWDARS